MATLLDEISDVEVLLALAPEELAPVALRAAMEFRAGRSVHLQDLSYLLFDQPGQQVESRFPRARRNEVDIALSEAWNWLIVNGLLVPEPGPNGNNGWMVLTRRGSRLIKSPADFRTYKDAATFPKSLLHSSIADAVWIALARGDLDGAVFSAFKAVEVAVRDAGQFAPTDIGVTLMRKAFDKTTGRLTDMSQPEPEREALAHLFAGAIGSYKNPHSHRTVSITDQRDAQEMVLLASHLLRIVDARSRPD